MKAFPRFAALATVAAVTPASIPVYARPTSFAIPAGPLSEALTDFSRAIGIQVIADPAVLRGRRTGGVRGVMAATQAMKALLRGSGLTFRQRGEVILIVSAPQSSASSIPPPSQLRRARAVAVPGSAVSDMVEAPAPMVVIGQRIADQRALATKRRARNIVDAIASDEMRRLPDNTVADAMRRIPGVSVVPIADNEHPRDVPIAPVVRGLTQAYNNVTINGMQVASTGIPDAASNSASRGVRLDILPTSLVSRLLVVKTFTPEFDPNAIGAAIDLQTRSAFDDGGRRFLSAESGTSSPSEWGQVQRQSRFGGHASVTASTTFGAEKQFGIVVSANYQRLQNNSNVHATGDSNFLSFYDDAGSRVDDAALGNGIPVPRQEKYWYNASDRRHMGATVRGEADLGALRLSVLAADYRFREGYIRNEIVFDPEDAVLVDQTPTSGHFDSASAQVGYRGGVTHNETQVVQFDVNWQPTSRDEFSLRAGLSRATMHEAYDMVKFTAGQDETGAAVGTNALGFGYDTSGLQFSFDVPAQGYYDLPLYSADYWRHRSRQAAARVDTIHADWRHGLDGAGDGTGFAAGLAATRTSYAYGYQSLAFGTSDLGLTLAQAGYVSNAALPFNRSGLMLIAVDPAPGWRMFDENQSSIFITDGVENDHEDDFRHRETVLAGYGMARFESGPAEVLAGARLEHTAIATQGYFGAGDTWTTQTTSSGYLRLLPSLLVNYQMLPRLKLRAGYSLTIGRPSYESYAPRSSIDFASESSIGDGNAAGVHVNLGNPDIDPRMSDNFDLSLEWSLTRRLDGMISAALFRKEIAKEIFDAVTVGYDYGGIYYRNAMVTKPTNATAAHISGLELSAVIGSLEAVIPALSGFGLSANWTVLGGAMSVPMKGGAVRTVDRLVGQPDEIRNLAVFYNRGGFELRGAMNWTGRALRSIAPDTVPQDVYWAPRRQFDVQARFHFGVGVSAILDIANLTRERVTSLTGPDAGWLKDSYSVPRVVRLSVNWGFGR